MPILILFLLSFNAYAQKDKVEETKKEYNFLIKKKYALIPHKGTYILPFLYSESPNQDAYAVFEKEVAKNEDRGDINQRLETEFQFSFLILTNEKIFRSDFDTFIGFTQRSWWQVYNQKWSRPFRETNYEPEFFARKLYQEPKNIFGAELLLIDFGIVHQSNGQIQELSRSWNRVFTRFVLIFGDISSTTSLWHRLPEKRSEDDNPDIYKYLGYGEFNFNYTEDRYQIGLRFIPGIEKQGMELTISLPWKEGLRFYTKIGYGYGLSLIDYNYNNKKIGFGIILSDLLTSQE